MKGGARDTVVGALSLDAEKYNAAKIGQSTQENDDVHNCGRRIRTKGECGCAARCFDGVSRIQRSKQVVSWRRRKRPRAQWTIGVLG